MCFLNEGLIINSSQSGETLKERLSYNGKIAVVDASRIAREVIGLPITNTTMLGSLLKMSSAVKKESFLHPLKERFGRIAEKNISAFERAYQETTVI